MSWPLTLLVDMDSILADFYNRVIEMYREETGDTGPVELNDWDMKFPNGKTCFPYFSQPGFFRNLKPIPGAQAVLKRFHDEEHEIVIASAATLTNAPGEKYEWLSEHYPWLHRDRVFFGKEKYRLRGDVFIDDHAANTREYMNHNPHALVLGIEYPYNRMHVAAFDHLVPSYRDYESAWKRMNLHVRRQYALPA